MNIRKTKIICTLGPSSDKVSDLVRLISAGMDAARLNFSHGSHEDHLQTIKNVREASEITGKPVAVLQDLQGPKIRTGLVENGGVSLNDGDQFVITMDDLEPGNSQRVSSTYKELINEVKVGNTILLDDGYLILKVENVSKTDITTTVIKGGILKNHKGIIVPGASSSAPSLSDKDLDDLKFGLNAGVDAVALSFVRSERDVLELKTAMKIFGRAVPIIAKIERYEGYKDIEKIIIESDAIMVARGDLGLEMPPEQVPIIQKDIIKACNFHGKPVIIATQMLESMILNPRPTRAEASDIANAVIDGGDCVMLSGETSIGRYPIDAVGYMDRIIRVIEEKYPAKSNPEELTNVWDAMGRASCVIADQIKASAIIPLTSSGSTAKNIAKYRPKIPILVLTDDVSIQRRMSSFIWGTAALLVSLDKSEENVYAAMANFAKESNYVKSGDYVVFVAGLSANKVMDENIIKIYQVG
ncbi:MAG: pyruvate kinase [Candidatus Kapabacteria bacterium]|nr:pyruvate kinase [Candidatus Kapabacteria bacterium]